MKRINQILIALSIIAGFASCEDLDVTPKNFYSGDNFFNTIEEAEVGLIYAYDALTYPEYSRGVFYLGELPSDNVGIKDSEGKGAQEIERWTILGNEEILLEYYRYAYMSINRTNAVIETLLENDFDDAKQDQILGEAYFLRAWNHFNLIRTYGLTPLQTQLVDEISETSASMPKDMNEVYTFLISDLKKAINLLEVKRSIGRGDKVAAQALLAKVYLYAASAKESRVPDYDVISTEVDELYSKAAAYADSAMNDQSEYSFDPSLMNIYDVDAYAGPEHIFIMSMDRSGTDEGDYSKISKMFIPYMEGADVYLMNTDSSLTKTHDGWSVFPTTDELVSTYDATDLRRKDLLVNEIFDEAGASSGTVESGVIQYQFTRKYVDPEFNGDKTSTRPFLIRYTDIALVYAEAVANEDGLAIYNQVRRRAEAEELASISGLSKDEFRTLIIEERRREFAFEGDRLHDLRRKRMVQSKVTEAAGLTDRDASFYPIPQQEVDLNPNID